MVLLYVRMTFFSTGILLAVPLSSATTHQSPITNYQLPEGLPLFPSFPASLFSPSLIKQGNEKQ